MNPIRKLAAIMFTDISGYTALSAKDEEKALDLIELQRELLKPIVAEFGGDWLKEIGDGLLLSFPSSKQAVNCAIKIQQTVKEIEDLNLRIGIHQGDILVKSGDVFGDDVNIASRIEPFAAVGGVAISDKVHRDISSSPEITTKYVGRPRLKGVTQKVEVYCITSNNLPETKLSDVSAKLEKKPTYWIKWVVPALAIFVVVLYFVLPKQQEVPSIGILYMENLGSEEDDFWARGITEDVIIEVAGAGLIRVAPMREILEFIASNSPLVEIAKKLRVKYLLTSSIYKKENSFDLRTQLIEAKSGKSIYAKKWSESLDKANTITETLAENILKSLNVSTNRDITKSYTPNPEAYEFYLRAKYKYNKRRNMEDTEVVRGLLNKSIEIDENLIKAKLLLGESYEGIGEYDKAMNIYTDCLILSKNQNMKEDIKSSLIRIGRISLVKADYENAMQNYEEALEIAIEIEDKLGESLILHDIGLIFSRKGNTKKASEYYKQSGSIKDKIGVEPSEPITAFILGEESLSAGDKKSADKYFNEALNLAEVLGYISEEIHIRILIAQAFNANGYNQEALNFYKQALEKSRKIMDMSSIRGVLQNVGVIYFQKDEYDQALEYYQEALELAIKLNDKYWIPGLLGNIILTYHVQEEYDKALKYYDQYLEIEKELGFKDQEGISHHIIGEIYVQKENYRKASEHFHAASTIWNELEDKKQHLWTLSWWVLSEAKNGNIEAAKTKADKTELLMKTTEPHGDDYIIVHWNLSQAYSLLGNNNKSENYLNSAFTEIEKRANEYTSEDDRNSFYDGTRENREVVAAWEGLNNDQHK
ncbi:MAG: tetratricopeptide repeat protein [Candidatus Marinimicrobia bacterium]|nr:tetratricopeptide repeat protein [Candidatus Neomarinimicrobiota bacterium]